MTVQEAIMVIQAIPERIWESLRPCEEEAIDIAFGALEKQDAKKIISPHKLFGVFDEGACPSCGERIYRREAYCHRCGQKLEWSED